MVGAQNKHSNSWQIHRNVKATVWRGSECQILSELLLLLRKIFVLIHYCSTFLGTTPHHPHLWMRNILSLWIYDEKTKRVKTQVHLLSSPTLCMNWVAVVNSVGMERVPRFPQKEGTTLRDTPGLPKYVKIQAFFKQNIDM